MYFNDFRNAFDRVVVINLERRHDRAEQFVNSIKKMDGGWLFREPEFLEAIDGKKIRPPKQFSFGNNVWGCLQSHRRAIENALNDDCESILILEDDAVFVPDFVGRAAKFLEDLPEDAEFAFFGGNLTATYPIECKPGIVKPFCMDRLHAYAVFNGGLLKLYEHLHGWHDKHADSIIGDWISTQKAYCVRPWLAGQREGTSDIKRIGDRVDGLPMHRDEQWWTNDDIRATNVRISIKLDNIDDLEKTMPCIDRGPIVGGAGSKPQFMCDSPRNRKKLTTLEENSLDDLWSCDGCKVRRACPPILSACMPTRGRANMAVESIRSFFSSMRSSSCEMIVVTHPDDGAALIKTLENDYPALRVIVADCTPIDGWNIAAFHAKGQLLTVWDDDLLAQPGWFYPVYGKWAELGRPEIAYFGLRDPLESRVPNSLFTRAVGTRRFFSELCGGALCIPEYKSWYDDNEKFEIAKRHGVAHYVPKSFIEHRHIADGQRADDDTNARQKTNRENDKLTFETRKSGGFPVTWTRKFF